MHFLRRLYETCKMICYSLLSNDVNLLKLGLSGYDVKPRFGAFQCEYLLQNPIFLEEKILVTLDTHTKKNEPTLDHSGGVHGKACWLIAYVFHL